MPVNLKGRSFLTLMDFTPCEIRYLLDLSRDLKAKKRAGIHEYNLKDKNIVLLCFFLKYSNSGFKLWHLYRSRKTG